MHDTAVRAVVEFVEAEITTCVQFPIRFAYEETAAGGIRLDHQGYLVVFGEEVLMQPYVILGKENGEVLRLEVADTGVGFYEDGNLGTGLDNIRERLQSLYGDKGRLILEENRPCGLKAIIEVPHATDQSNHR